MRIFFLTVVLGIIAGPCCNAFTSNNAPIAIPASEQHHAAAAAIRLGRGVNSGARSILMSLAESKAGDDTPAIGEDFSGMTVAQLKDRLRELSLTVGGKKAELIERLNEHYSNSNQTPIGIIGSERMEEVEVEVEEEEQEKHDIIIAVDQSSDTDDSDGNEDESKSTDLQSESEDDLSKLTVPALKDRLRELQCPVGGRKAELIERLMAAIIETNAESDPVKVKVAPVVEESKNEDSDDKESFVSESGEVEDVSSEGRSSKEDDKDSTLLNILDELFDDDEAPLEESNGDLSNDDLLELESESDSIRRARRKKYWKTQEVRDLIKSADPRASAKAEEMIETLEKIAKEEQNDEFLPGVVQYTMLIDAYAKSGTAEGIQRAESIIDRILNADEKTDGTAIFIAPTAQMLNAVMGAYANVGNVEAAEKATTILERMEYIKEFGGSVKPTVHSYSIAISAWAKCESEGAAENAQNLLEKLFESYDELLDHEGQMKYAEELKPNNFVFNSVIDAWARSGSSDAGKKAEALLERMEVVSRMDEYDVRPDTISFNTCIKAWCNSGNPLKADEVLSKLETNPQYPKRNGGVLVVRPNRLSYNTVINAWAKSTMPESAVRAEALLLRMIKSFKSEAFSTITPDAVTFASVLNALAKSTTTRLKADKCSAILKAMIDLHEDDGSFGTKPNIICYNTVLNACAFSARGSPEEKRNALKTSVGIFNQMREGKYVSPDAVSYGNMLKCFANLMAPSDQRTAMASRIFGSCCDEGLVGGMCLDEIRRSIPPRAFLPLLADCGYGKPLRQRRKAHSIELSELPKEWTKNVKRGDMVSRQRGSFEKPKQRQEERRRRPREEKSAPVIRRPRMVVEYGASSKDL